MSMYAVIYLKMENGKTLQNTYEYASDGVVPQIKNVANGSNNEIAASSCVSFNFPIKMYP